MNGIIINGSMEYHNSSSSFYFFIKLYWIAFYVDFDKKMFPVFLKIFLNRTRPGFKRIDEKFLCSRPDLPGKDKIKNLSNVVKIKVRFRNPAILLPFLFVTFIILLALVHADRVGNKTTPEVGLWDYKS